MWFVWAMLGNVLWSITDVWASVVVNRFHKGPVVFGFFLGIITNVILLLLLLYRIPDATWMWWLGLSSLFAYVGMLGFFFALTRVDVSVSSAAWIFMSIGIAVGGLLLFGEKWSVLQAIGAILSVIGVFLLSFWHKHVSLVRTCVILAVPGFMFVPYFLLNDAVLSWGASAYDAFFWCSFFHSSIAIVVPFLVKRYRQEVIAFSARFSSKMFLILVPRTLLTSVATYATIMSYALGDASLAGMAENGQPFFIMFFAWLATAMFPKHAPKELLTKQSIGLKIVSFCITFTGLGLLALG